MSLKSGRLYLYGYRMNEIRKINLPNCKNDLKIGATWFKALSYNSERICLSKSLPLCFTGATPPRPDPGHPPSLVGGILKRFGYQPPPLDRAFKRKFKRFVQLWLKQNLKPLTPDNLLTFDDWLAQTPYSESRRIELKKAWDSLGRLPDRKKFAKIKSFIKDETYEEFKYCRLINSRVDGAKCYFGPNVQSVSDELFKNPFFIKKIPVPDRPAAIRDSLVGNSGAEDGDFIFTDYTAFEAHFTREIMEITQVLLMRYMLQNCHQETWLRDYQFIMTGRNFLQFKHVSCSLNATRMSGEMDTSLSNGFSNLMLFLFACQERGATSVLGFVEGDDGLFRVSPSHCAPTKEDFEKLGFTIKIGHTTKLSEASFCGQVYDMSELKVVTNPLEVIARLGWTNKKYVECSEKTAMELLRSRGYSLVYQYGSCPLLGVLGRRILDLTDGISISEKVLNNMDQWEREKMRAAMAAKLPEMDVGPNTYALVEKLYGIPVARQLELEADFAEIELGQHSFTELDRKSVV